MPPQSARVFAARAQRPRQITFHEENKMRFEIRKRGAAAALAASAALLAPGASAEGLDGSRDMVCAAVSVVACGEGPSCFQGLARTFELPEFMFVDMKAKVVRATAESPFKDVDSPIKNSETTRSQFVLQGIENGHGWSMSIDRASGRMVATLSGELVSYMIFGACTAQ
jgi:hypothetical protein